MRDRGRRIWAQRSHLRYPDYRFAFHRFADQTITNNPNEQLLEGGFYLSASKRSRSNHRALRQSSFCSRISGRSVASMRSAPSNAGRSLDSLEGGFIVYAKFSCVVYFATLTAIPGSLATFLSQNFLLQLSIRTWSDEYQRHIVFIRDLSTARRLA